MKVFYVLFFFVIHNSSVPQDFWHHINTLQDHVIQSIVTDSNGYIYIAAGSQINNSMGLYVSFDNGQSFKSTDLIGSPCRDCDISSSQRIYALGGNWTMGFGVFKSEDQGTSWTHLFYVGDWYSLKCGFDSIILVGCNRMEGILRSGDYGQTWDTAFSITSNLSQWFTDFAYATDHVIYASSRNPFEGDRGVYFSEDYGNTWQYLGLNEEAISLEVDNYNNLLVGTVGSGLFRYNKNEAQWEWLVYSTTVNDIVVSPDDRIFLAMLGTPNFNGGVMISPDNGNTFYYVNSGLIPDYNVGNFAFDEFGRMYCTEINNTFSDLYLSNDTIITSVEILRKIENIPFTKYPNPCKDFIEIKSLNNKCPINEISIFTTSGIALFKICNLNKDFYMIDTSNLKQGIYVVLLRSEEKTFSSKFVKVN